MFNSSILLNPMLHTRLSNDWEPNKQEDKHWLKILKLHLINTSNKNEFQAHKSRWDEIKRNNGKKVIFLTENERLLSFYVCEYTISNSIYRTDKNALQKLLLTFFPNVRPKSEIEHDTTYTTTTTLYTTLLIKYFKLEIYEHTKNTPSRRTDIGHRIRNRLQSQKFHTWSMKNDHYTRWAL